MDIHVVVLKLQVTIMQFSDLKLRLNDSIFNAIASLAYRLPYFI